MFLYFSFSRHGTVRKIPEKIYKKSAFQKVPRSRRAIGGGPPGPQAPWWRGHPPGRAGRPPGPPGPRLALPFGIYLHLVPKPSRTEPFFAILSLFRRRRASKIGSARRTLPGTLPEGR